MTSDASRSTSRFGSVCRCSPATTPASANTDRDDSPETDKSDFNGAAATTTDKTSLSVSIRTATTPDSASSCLTTPSPRDVRDPAGSSHYHYSPKVVYGAGAVSRLPTELGRLHLVCPLIVSSPSRISLARRIQGLIPNLDSRILDSALVNVPQHVVDDAVFRITGRDCVISVGGASAVSLAKSIAARKDIPHICIPTTYSGSEHPTQDHTRRLERKESRRKRSGSSSKSPTSTASTSKSKSPNANKSPVSSKSPGGSSHQSRRSEIKSRPTIIIYDEDLTATDTPTHFSVPNDDKIPAKTRYRYYEDDENAQWSYIHLPGV
jgi:hypothetical protein